MNDPAGPNEHGLSSSPGKLRANNEDAVLAEPNLGLWVVADGMGGHSSGEVASAIVVDRIEHKVRDGADLESAVLHAQRALEQAVDLGDGSKGMGTTVVAVRIINSRYQIAWVGDSRAYVWHDGHLRQLTNDHSYVQKLLDEGLISQDEAERHPERAILTRCMGGGLDDELLVDTVVGTLFAGERLLLCSDGINSELGPARIAACLSETLNESAADAARRLVDAALEAGGNDNATAIVISAASDAPQRIRQTAPRPVLPSTGQAGPDRLRKSALIVTALVLLLVACGAVVYYLGNRSYKEPTIERFNQPVESSEKLLFEQKPEVRRSDFENGEEK